MISSSKEERKLTHITRENVDTELQKWPIITKQIRDTLTETMIRISKLSAKRPIFTISATITVSVSLFATGILTNYHYETSDKLWSPSYSYTSIQDKWLKTLRSSVESNSNSSGYREIVGLIHKNGNDVATIEGMEKLFEVVNVIKGLDGQLDCCDGSKTQNCIEITAASSFWDNDYGLYKESNITTDKQVKEFLSSFVYPDGKYVYRDFIFGAPNPDTKDMDDIIRQEIQASMYSLSGELDTMKEKFELTSVKSFLIFAKLPGKLEKEAIINLLKLNKGWTDFNLSTSSSRSHAAEGNRGMKEDLPLMAVAFFIMTSYCCFTLSKYHQVKSQSILGIGAVFTIIMSLSAGYGLLFIVGLPLTPLTYLFPYAMLGIGLDDTFVLTGAFDRTDPAKDVVLRIVDTINNVGMSIFVTTLTTVVAFSFGSLSSLPGLRLFCIYAALTVTIDFFYQITFFVAIMVLDNRRVKANRLDCLICIVARNNTDGETNNLTKEIEEERQKALTSNTSMSIYSRILLKPISKVVVLTLFTIIFVASFFIASCIKEDLDVREILPEDSFVRDYISDLEEFTKTGEVSKTTVKVVFRDVDVSDTRTQTLMKNYIDDIAAMPYISSQPENFWLKDFEMFLMYNHDVRDNNGLNFNEKLDIFLSTPPYKDIYPNLMVRDEKGNVKVSWTYLRYDEVSIYDAPNLVKAFQEQQRVTALQPINEGSLDGHFFTFGNFYYTCEMWVVLKKEIMSTLIMGLVSVFIVSLMFIPHPLAAVILTPTVFAIFVEVVAVMRLAGLHIDPFTSAGLIACLGIVMDYNIHVCQSYFEIEGCTTRNEKVTKLMNTMGTSIMKCGFTNILGVLPLSLNSTLAFRTIFVTFVAFTSLGIAHGLIFLPVSLSLIGPMDMKSSHKTSTKGNTTDSLTISDSFSTDGSEV